MDTKQEDKQESNENNSKPDDKKNESQKNLPAPQKEPTTAETSADVEMKEADVAMKDNQEEDKSKSKATKDSEKTENSEAAPPSAFSNRDSWDTTHRKVVIHNMFKFEDNKKGRKLADQWAQAAGVTVHKVRKPPNDTFMAVTLVHESMVQPYIDYINDTPTVVNKRGLKLFAKRAGAGDDDRPNSKKRSRNDDDDDKEEANPNRTTKRGQKRQHRETQAAQARQPQTLDQVRDKMTPLFRLTREQQTLHKQRDMVRNCARKLVSEIKGRFRSLQRDANRVQSARGRGTANQPYRWLSAKRCLHVEDVLVIPSPLRNKVEFTFGYRYAYADDNDKEEANASANKTTGASAKNSASATNDSDQQKEDATMTDTAHAGAGTDASSETVATQSADAATTDEKESSARPVRKIPSVGFMAAGWSGGVSLPTGCANIAPEMCRLVEVLERDFLQNSPLPPYDSKLHSGFWRYLTVRTSRRTRQCLVMVVHAPPATGGVGDDAAAVDYTAAWPTERQRLIDLLQAIELPTQEEGDSAPPLRVTSLFFQEFGGVSNPPTDHPVQHVFGKTVLEEELYFGDNSKCVFEISPGAFFQVNTPGAERLYQLVMTQIAQFVATASATSEPSPAKTTAAEKEGETKPKEDADVATSEGEKKEGTAPPAENVKSHPQQSAEPPAPPSDGQGDSAMDTTTKADDNTNNKTPRKPKVVLFDVCCGTGTIGLACLKQGVVDQVIGIDISEPAIRNAQRNAERNGFTSDEACFVASRAEHVMQREISKALKAQQDNVLFVAVVDPAREGLHSDVVKAIRQTEAIRRLVYVSCNPTGSMVKDAGLLCAPPTKRYCGRAFRPVTAMPVDMFPLTNHCEMVMTFDRIKDEEM